MSDCSPSIFKAKTPEQILGCWETMAQLRPHLVRSEFVTRVQAQQEEGYVLLYLVDVDKNSDSPGGKSSAIATATAKSILGYRVHNKLFSGKVLYIDDFCSHVSARGKGYGRKLLESVQLIAVELNCGCVTLDSGYARNDAHRFYLNNGFRMASHHFYMALKP